MCESSSVLSNVAYRVPGSLVVHGTQNCAYLANADLSALEEVSFNAPDEYKTSLPKLEEQLPEGTRPCTCFRMIKYEEREEPPLTEPDLDLFWEKDGHVAVACPYCGDWAQIPTEFLLDPRWFNLKGEWVGRDEVILTCSTCAHPLGRTGVVSAQGAIALMWQTHLGRDLSLSASLLHKAYIQISDHLQQMVFNLDETSTETEAMAKIVALKFGLWSGKRRSNEEISQVMGITKAQVAKLYKQGLRVLSYRLGKNPLSTLAKIPAEIEALQQILAVLLPGVEVGGGKFHLLAQPVSSMRLQKGTIEKLNGHAAALSGTNEPMVVAQLLHLMKGGALISAGLGIGEISDIVQALDKLGFHATN